MKCGSQNVFGFSQPLTVALPLAVAFRCSLILVGIISDGGQALTVVRGSDLTNIPKEYMEVSEGSTLIMNCSVSNKNWQHDVWWGRKYDNAGNVDWLTQDSDVETSDSRVSVTTFWAGYFTYSVRITDITADDFGIYICYVTWWYSADRQGYVDVSVKNFPKEEPVCFMNTTEYSTTDNVSMWCDTLQGYPGVTVTWDYDNGPGSVYILENKYADATGQDRVRTELQLIPSDWGNNRTREFICTVTSSEFPGLYRTCSLNVTVDQEEATTVRSFDVNTHLTGTGFTMVPGSTTVDPVPGIPKGSDATQVEDSSTTDTNIAVALAIPVFLVVVLLFILLIRFLKSKRQRKNRQNMKLTERMTSSELRHGDNIIRRGKVAVPYSVTELTNVPHNNVISNAVYEPVSVGDGVVNDAPLADLDLSCHPYSVTRRQQNTDSGVCVPDSAYESCRQTGEGTARDGLAGECDVYTEITDKCNRREAQGQMSSADYETGKPADGDVVYEVFPGDVGSGGIPKVKNSTRNSSMQASTTLNTPMDGTGEVDDHFMKDESMEGTIINPIYQSYGNEKGEQSDEPHTYQIISY